MSRKPDKTKGAPAGASEAVPGGTPEWLRAAIEWKPPAAGPAKKVAKKRGRQKGSRNTVKNARGGDQLQPLNNAVRERALGDICAAVSDGRITTDKQLGAMIKRIAAKVGITDRQLRNNLHASMSVALSAASCPPWSVGECVAVPPDGPPTQISTVRAFLAKREAQLQEQALAAARRVAEEEYFAEMQRLGFLGN